MGRRLIGMRFILPILLLWPAPGALAQDAHEELNLGVAAFKSADYTVAAKHFAEAVRLAPDLTTARLYLGAGYMMMYIPGAESAENLKNAQLALEQFQQVLSVEPENETAIA